MAPKRIMNSEPHINNKKGDIKKNIYIYRCNAYVSERLVGEKREAFEQVLVVIVLDHRRPFGLEQKHTAVRGEYIYIYKDI